MLKTIGLVALALIGMRLLSDRVITVDVNAGADRLRDIGGYTLNGGTSGQQPRLVVPYNPNSGQVGQPQYGPAYQERN
ncbi:MAG TPA: hypothetical protein V6D10_05840 [Trichocoleus sp.]